MKMFIASFILINKKLQKDYLMNTCFEFARLVWEGKYVGIGYVCFLAYSWEVVSHY